ncbi:HTH-type transcriptional regulator HmrR (plasmid) [Sphingobium sp. AntQ-1]|uniref:MerR family transcriptional regulator n=1 Tax=Sphingobium sp. AntQ-1 TaxID=2930091 RepID=UPI00234F1D6C|nr:helix-turn-helix domain-containing protein [Sphingobium sp. AntQ-1]WCP16152.1 HTH-type transcriptional regulator HmrR [Sphingobium sp. AntQ-1]
MQIGELSRATDTKVTTIRFYEEIGLLGQPVRTASGRRTYGLPDTDRLNFIRNARRLGFSIDEVRSLLALADQPERDCGDAAKIAARHLADVEQRLRQLSALRDELAAMSAAGCCAKTMAECRVIQAIARPAA